MIIRRLVVAAIFAVTRLCYPNRVNFNFVSKLLTTYGMSRVTLKRNANEVVNKFHSIHLTSDESPVDFGWVASLDSLSMELIEEEIKLIKEKSMWRDE